MNLNRFAAPQFAQTYGDERHTKLRWREWRVEIPDSFVRKFGGWCAEHGVKGKYSIVPFPACVGRLDRMLPGWTQRELEQSIELVRTLMMPNWDIHPEMVTHTRVIDLKTGHPYPEFTPKFMENWEWSVDRSVDEMTDYMVYALRILKEIGLPCDAEIPALTTLAEAPMRVALPPRVPPNIMATKTGSVSAGQSVKAGPSAISGTSSAATK